MLLPPELTMTDQLISDIGERLHELIQARERRRKEIAEGSSRADYAGRPVGFADHEIENHARALLSAIEKSFR
jgi:hypothetical protein